jgi:diguanylate cyclase (GGDEF)-like protein
MDSKVGLIVQIAGVALITLLTLFLRRSINVPALRHWTNAWLFQCFALFCLRLAFSYEEYSLQLLGFYFLSQYVFGYLLVLGCRSLSKDSKPGIASEIFVLPFIVVAFGLPFLGNELNLITNIHSLLLAGFFAIAFTTLFRTRLKTFGWNVMLVALGLLAINFAQYFVEYTLQTYLFVNIDLLEYNAIIDLVLQILLGFGMVIVLLEQVLNDANVANEKLKKAHEKLEELAHIDPLTTALNRHAFHGYLNRKGNEGKELTGCLGFFDIDDLKEVNDQFGHGVGDAVIRNVVRAIRELIRGEDLIFRWGGDEFFVLMVGISAEAATVRMRKVDELLKDISIDGAPYPVSIRVSHAFENFSSLAEIEDTIQKADAGMYRVKQARKLTQDAEDISELLDDIFEEIEVAR